MQEISVTFSTPPLLRLEFRSRHNTLTQAVLEELASALEEAEQNPEVHWLLLRGAGNRFFSPGLNLHEAVTLSPKAMRTLMHRFLAVSARLLSFPKPVIAALNGDALAGGFLLASCCQGRVAVDGVQLGLTPLSIQIGVPRLNAAVLDERIGTSASRRLLESGAGLSTDQAIALGWLDAVTSAADLEAAATGLFRSVARSISDTAATTSPDLSEAARNRDLEEFLRRWHSGEVQQALTAAVARLNSH